MKRLSSFFSGLFGLSALFCVLLWPAFCLCVFFLLPYGFFPPDTLDHPGVRLVLGNLYTMIFLWLSLSLFVWYALNQALHALYGLGLKPKVVYPPVVWILALGLSVWLGVVCYQLHVKSAWLLTLSH